MDLSSSTVNSLDASFLDASMLEASPHVSPIRRRSVLPSLSDTSLDNTSVSSICSTAAQLDYGQSLVDRTQVTLNGVISPTCCMAAQLNYEQSLVNSVSSLIDVSVSPTSRMTNQLNYDHSLIDSNLADVSVSSTLSVTDQLNYDQTFVSSNLDDVSVSPTSAIAAQNGPQVAGTGVCSASSHMCEICNKSFSSKYNLKRHFQRHDADYQFKCHVCVSFFKTKEELETHSAKSHIGNNLCVTCGKTFARKNALADHTLKHTRDTYQSPSKRLFVCPFESCNKKFVRKTIYQDHLNTHSDLKPYTCETCNKQFNGRYRLNFHKRVCSGGLKFVCDVCNFNLSDPTALKRHKEGKHGLKVHACLCGKHYKYYSSLYKHKKEKEH